LLILKKIRWLKRKSHPFGGAKDADMINSENRVNDVDQHEFVLWGKSLALHYIVERQPGLFTFDVDAEKNETVSALVPTSELHIESASDLYQY
jgi:hypothetical protein